MEEGVTGARKVSFGVSRKASNISESQDDYRPNMGKAILDHTSISALGAGFSERAESAISAGEDEPYRWLKQTHR